MIINKIALYNFGSYEGLNVIDTKTTKNKNIVLFGGKNGAGKTTLFSSMGLCLYGNISLGINTKNTKYFKKIQSYINNNALINGDKEAYIKLELSLENGRDVDNYTIIRKWTVNNSIDEQYIVIKNEARLDEQQVADFEKYIFSLIPPELFNLYFFDGEKITDFFINEEGNKKFKQAFLTLCGYDIFEIMHKNFKRNVVEQGKENDEFERYSALKTQIQNIQSSINEKSNRSKDIDNELKDIDTKINELNSTFYKSGGVTELEYRKLEEKIKAEEQKRDEWNYTIKKWANDTIPFVMIKNNILKLKEQISKESQTETVEGFIDFVNSKSITKYLQSFENGKSIKEKLIEIAKKEKSNDCNVVLDYSKEQSYDVTAIINRVLDFDENLISEYKSNILKSIEVTTKLKKKMDKISSDGSNKYINEKSALLDRKNQLVSEKLIIESEINKINEEYKNIEPEYNKAHDNLEKAIKKDSINDISVKAVLMLESLQKKLFETEINKLISNFKINSSLLFNKKNLVSDIDIDDDFKIHVYQNIKVSINKLKDTILNNKLNSEYIVGDKTREAIINKANIESNDIETALKKLAKTKTSLDVPMEINFENLSAGERQVFIMSLYLSLVQLGNVKVPFVIDTPFARIDYEHRNNITKHFFSNLGSQVFILSTNKEIDNENILEMKNKLAKTFTLVNNKSKTEIFENQYFGEEYDI